MTAATQTTTEVKVPGHRRLQRRAGHRGARQARRRRQRRRSTGHAGVGQSDDGCPIAGRWRGRRCARQGRRYRERGHADLDASTRQRCADRAAVTGGTARCRPRPRRPAPTPVAAAPAPTAPTAPCCPAGACSARCGSARRSGRMGPSVRRMAREFDIDLGAVTGTGPKGRITKEDLLGFLRGPAEAPAPAAAPAGMGIPEIPAQDFSKFGPVETKALARIKRISGPFLHRSWLNVPHVTHTMTRRTSPTLTSTARSWTPRPRPTATG